MSTCMAFMRTVFPGLLFCSLALSLSCPSETAMKSAVRPARAPHDFVVFFTGSELGALKPCGCSGGQLGGLEKRTSVFASVPQEQRLVVGTGALVASDGEQDLIKFRIMYEAFGLLDYDMVHFTGQDLAIAESLGLVTDAERPFDVINAAAPGPDISATFEKELQAAGRSMTVRVAAFDVREAPVERAADLFSDAGGAGRLNVLILGPCDGPAIPGIIAAAPPAIDCMVFPSDSDEPRLLSEPGARPLAFTVGRFGRYIGRVGVTVREGGEKPALQFQQIAVEGKLPDDAALVQLYRSYQQLVKAAGLLAKYPRLPLPQDLAFVGSAACKRCHEYEYDQWSTKAHADAFATLKEVGSDYDPECVICHVVGMEYTGGFITEEKTPHLKDVGCENCHGPGSQHILTLGQARTAEPKMTCLQCHTPEQSAEYAGHEEEYMEKIVHWREP